MFENSLWRSKSHSFQLVYVFVAPVIAFLLVAFIMAYFHLGKIGFIIAGVGIAGVIVAMIVLSKEIKWHNPKLIFAFDGVGVLFSSTDTTASYFYDEYDNIEGYDYKELKNGLANVTVYLKTVSDAGMFGKVKEIKMIKIENYAAVLDILNERGVPRIQNHVKINKDNSL